MVRELTHKLRDELLKLIEQLPKVSRARQLDSRQGLSVKVDDALNSCHFWLSQVSIEGEAVDHTVYVHVGRDTAEAVHGEHFV